MQTDTQTARAQHWARIEREAREVTTVPTAREFKLGAIARVRDVTGDYGGKMTYDNGAYLFFGFLKDDARLYGEHCAVAVRTYTEAVKVLKRARRWCAATANF